MTIKEISDLRKTQDNKWHITSDPVYIVQKKVRRYGFTNDYVEKFIWLEDGEEIHDEELMAELNEADEDWRKWDNLDDSQKYQKVYYEYPVYPR